MSCGWCELAFDELSAKKKTHNLTIHGGSPTAEEEIRAADLRTNRSGLKALQKTFAGGVKQRLTVEVKPVTALPPEVRDYLELMPSTCLVHQPLLTFVVGFMNYKGEKLLRESGGGFRKPAGDAVISCFPKIYDNPDIVEELVAVWVEDVQPRIAGDHRNYDYIMSRTKDFICRLYPVLYSEEFKGMEHSGTTRSANMGDRREGNLLAKRQALVQSALRHGQVHSTAKKVEKAPSELTTFKPFSVRELDYDVWDTTRARQDKFLAQLGAMRRGPSYNDPGPSAPPEPGRRVHFQN